MTSDVTSIVTVIPNATNAAVNTFQCDICNEEHNSENVATLSGCTHYFCFDCIERWTSQRRTCPLCRSEVSAIIIHTARFPLKQKLKVMVTNYSGEWRRNFYIPRNMMFTDALLDIYAERSNPVREGDGIPTYQYGRDVFIYFDGSRIKYKATPKKLGMLQNDVLVIRHTITIFFNMPGSGHFERKGATGWWDATLGEFIQSFFEKMGLDSEDFLFSYNSEVIKELDYYYSLEVLGYASGDLIRVSRKEKDRQD